MKAMVRSEYGGPEVLRLQEVKTPTPRADEALVWVGASSVNMADVDYLRGRPALARMATGVRGPKARVPGIDMAGMVEAVGTDVSEVEPGDRVWADLTDVGSGAWAEYVAVPAAALTPMPANLSFEEAATAPSSGLFAWQGLHSRRRVAPGDRVLVNGASGNVGPFAVQMAKALGAEVTGVASASKLDMVRALGADQVADYADGHFSERADRYDHVIELAARAGILECRRSLRPGGAYVVIGGDAAGYLQAILVGPVISIFSSRKAGLLMWKANRREDMLAMKDLFEGHRIRPHIDRTFPLADAPEAISYLESGGARGKVVIAIGSAALPSPRP